MITLDKTAVPLHTMSVDELVTMTTEWYREGMSALAGNDMEGYVQAAGFYRAYVKELHRRR